MDTPSGGRDSRFMSYNISLLGNDQEMYGAVHRPSTSTPPMSSSRSGLCCNVNSAGSRGVKRSSNDVLYDNDGRQMIDDVVDDGFASPAPQKGSPPANGKKTKGRVKIKMEYIDNKLRRYTTFSKRKTGIMKKAYELSTLTGTQVMLLVASETGHVYTFATRKLQPMITSDAGKALIQTCLNSPDPCQGGGLGGGGGSGSCGPGGDQRMSATGFEETELSYNIATAADEEQKVRQLVYGGGGGGSAAVAAAVGLMHQQGGGGGHVMGHPPHHPSSPHHHHHLMLHQNSPSSHHLIPCSSPSAYQQACPSPLPHYPPHPHMSHQHNQR